MTGEPEVENVPISASPRSRASFRLSIVKLRSGGGAGTPGRATGTGEGEGAPPRRWPVAEPCGSGSGLLHDPDPVVGPRQVDVAAGADQHVLRTGDPAPPGDGVGLAVVGPREVQSVRA